ncbi:MAG: hypothetical protein NVS1B4_15360 [Gemmatimonadaceae bacterium]
MQLLEPRPEEVLGALGLRVPAHGKEPAHCRRQMQSLAEACDDSGIRGGRRQPTRGEARARTDGW